MKKNVGTVDKWVRIVLGLAVLSLVFFLDGGLRWLGLIGLIFIVTGLINFCPLYLPFGISTIKKK
jgi:hypothetical protein